jgi:DNA polymerase I
MYPSIIIDRNLCFTTLADDGEILTPHGVRFQSPDVRRGLLPELLEGLMAERDSAKRAEAAATGAEAEHYRRVQEAIKILMNSVYGVFASYFYRFTNLDIGASITAYAREAVRDIIAELEREGLAVIYGDTDSVFFGSPHATWTKRSPSGKPLRRATLRGRGSWSSRKSCTPSFRTASKSATSASRSGRARRWLCAATRRGAPTHSQRRSRRCRKYSRG